MGGKQPPPSEVHLSRFNANFFCMLISGLPGCTFVPANVRSCPSLALSILFEALGDPQLAVAFTGLQSILRTQDLNKNTKVKGK